LRPASTKEITAEELAYIKAEKRYAKLAARLSVIDVKRKPPRAAKPPAAKPVVPPPSGVPHKPEKKKGDGK
jgi:hypothetical protein